MVEGAKRPRGSGGLVPQLVKRFWTNASAFVILNEVKNLRSIVSLALLALLAIACQEPLSTEQYVLGGGPYVFTVDMSDTTATYDFDLYTRLDGEPEDLISLQGTLLRAEWRSPSDSLQTEKIYLPLKGQYNTYYSKQVYEPYRTGVRPAEAGIWTLSIRQEDRSQVVPLRGLGLVVRKVR